MAYNTGNPVPSANPKDLFDNAENLDRSMQSNSQIWVDRLGRERKTWAAFELEGNEKIEQLQQIISGADAQIQQLQSIIDGAQEQINSSTFRRPFNLLSEAKSWANSNPGDRNDVYLVLNDTNQNNGSYFWNGSDLGKTNFQPANESELQRIADEILLKTPLTLARFESNREWMLALIDDQRVLSQLRIRLDDGKFPDDIVLEWFDRMRGSIRDLIDEGAPVVNPADRYFRNGEALPVNANTASLVGWGSSTMVGLSGSLASYASSKSAVYTNMAKGGEQSPHMTARMGAVPALLTFPGNSIPASGSVTVTSSNMPVNANLLTFSGAVGGVAGTLSSTASALTFTRTTPGSAVSIAVDTPFIPTVGPAYRNSVAIISVGRNDLTGAAGRVERVIQNIAAAVDWLSPLYKRVLVMGSFVNTSLSDVNSVRSQIYELNAALAKIYGLLYLDTQSYITGEQVWIDTGITPTQSDLEYQARGNKPPSLSSDDLHWNAALEKAYTDYQIEPRIETSKWYL